jgi:hypothetical protein
MSDLARPRDRTVAPLETTILPAGTALFHGTDCAGDFSVPDGPAWFAFTLEKATEWAGWSDQAPEGRTKGERRVLSFRLAADAELPDTRDSADWRRLSRALCGDDEAGVGEVADGAAAAGLPGWRGRAEVMLVDPARWLVHEATVSLEAADETPGPGMR